MVAIKESHLSNRATRGHEDVTSLGTSLLDFGELLFADEYRAV